jgi:hypothetical protein
MSFSHEGHLIHTESAAPAKDRLTRTLIEEAAGPDHFFPILIVFFWGALTLSALKIYSHVLER